MAKDPDDGPNLELPSFGLRRRRKPDKAAGAEEPASEQPAEPAPPEPPSSEPPVPERTVRTAAAVATPAPVPAPAPTTGDVPREPAPEAPTHEEVPRGPLLPSIGTLPAAAVTGVLVGLATVGLTWLSQRGCEAVRGTSSCGGGPGLLLLIAIVVVSILLGSLLLRAWGVPSPGSTSFLAVALVAVVAMLFLTDVIFDRAMVVVVPAAGLVAFTLAAWVTTTFVEPGERRR